MFQSKVKKFKLIFVFRMLSAWAQTILSVCLMPSLQLFFPLDWIMSSGFLVSRITAYDLYLLLDSTAGDVDNVVAFMKEFFIPCFFLLFCFRKTLSKEDMFSIGVLLNIREKSDSTSVWKFTCENFLLDMKNAFNFFPLQTHYLIRFV